MLCTACNQPVGKENLFRTGPTGVYSLFAMGTAQEALCSACAMARLEQGQRLHAQSIPNAPGIIVGLILFFLCTGPLSRALGLGIRGGAILGVLALLAALAIPGLVPSCRMWRRAERGAAGPEPLANARELLGWVTEKVRAGVPDREIRRSDELEPVTSPEAELLLWAARRETPSPEA